MAFSKTPLHLVLAAAALTAALPMGKARSGSGLARPVFEEQTGPLPPLGYRRSAQGGLEDGVIPPEPADPGMVYKGFRLPRFNPLGIRQAEANIRKEAGRNLENLGQVRKKLQDAIDRAQGNRVELNGEELSMLLHLRHYVDILEQRGPEQGL